MFSMGQILSSSKSTGQEPYTYVFEAVETGKIWKLHFYRDEIPNFNKLTLHGKSLLHSAVRHQRLECVKFLIESGVDCNIRDTCDNTPLLEIVQCKWKEKEEIKLRKIIEVLIKSKANIDATNGLSRTALLKSIILFRHNISKMLLQFGANTNIPDDDGLLPIHVCATYSSLPLLQEVLNHRADINAQDKKGRTALYFAVLSGHQKIVDELVFRGSDLNLGSSLGFPLQTAIVKCKMDAVQALLENGANVTLKVVEYRQHLLKAKDCLNLAMVMVNMELSSLKQVLNQTPTHNNDMSQATDRFLKTCLILDMIIQAYGIDATLCRTIFTKTRKMLHFENMPDLNSVHLVQSVPSLSRKVGHVLQRLNFMHQMSKAHQGQTAEDMPKVNVGLDPRSLQNISRMVVRDLVTKHGSNVVYAVDKLDCSVIVKDILLLKDI